MSEQLQTRTEHSRSLEDAEKYRAIQTLIELGMLVPLSELETFHGRVGKTDDSTDWEVQPTFANGKNDGGNVNLHARSALYTSKEEIAEAFSTTRHKELAGQAYRKTFNDVVRGYSSSERQAWLDRENQRREERWKDTINKPKLYTDDDLHRIIWREGERLQSFLSEEEKQRRLNEATDALRTEIHEIISYDTDAIVMDLNFKASDLSPDQMKAYKQALVTLASETPITEGSPVDFGERHNIAPVVSTMNKMRIIFSSEEDIQLIAQQTGIDVNTVKQITSGRNAFLIARGNPLYLMDLLAKNTPGIVVADVPFEDGKKSLPINLEYAERYVRNIHVIGMKHSVDSDTIDKTITSVSLFDLEKVQDKTVEKRKQAEVWKRLGGMTTALEASTDGFVGKSELGSVLNNAYAKPQELVDAAMKVEGYGAIYNADAGNWEGFTLAEHTETVLRNFDETYADKIPVELLAPMRLAILAHDLGKPEAAAKGQRYRQKEYNAVQAADFFTKLDIDDKTKQLLLAVIGDGAELAFQIDIKHAGERAENAMRGLAVQTLQEFNGSQEVSDAQIDSFIEMCKMLQICDGGAYTSMAVTRSRSGVGRYRNAPSFNRSFAQPVCFGKRTLKLRGLYDQSAAENLTPKQE